MQRRSSAEIGQRSSAEIGQKECTFTVPQFLNKESCDIEFISAEKSLLYKGSILSIAELRDTYLKLLSVNGVRDFFCDKRAVKYLLQKHIPGVEFCKSAKRNESEKVLIKTKKEEVVNEALSQDLEDDMYTLFRSAKILRTIISKCEAWKFQGTFSKN